MATNAHKSELQLLHPASNYSLKAAKVCTDRYDSATLSSKETYFDQQFSKSTIATEEKPHENILDDLLQETLKNFCEIQKLQEQVEKIKKSNTPMKYRIQFLESIQSKLVLKTKQLSAASQKLKEQLMRSENIESFESLMAILNKFKEGQPETKEETKIMIVEPPKDEKKDIETKKLLEIGKLEENFALKKHERNQIIMAYENYSDDLVGFRAVLEGKKTQAKELDVYAENLKAKLTSLSSFGLTTPRNLRYHMRTVTDINTVKQFADMNNSKLLSTKAKDNNSKKGFESSRLHHSRVNSSIFEDVGQTMKSFLSKNVLKRETVNNKNVLPAELLQAQPIASTSRKF